MSFILDALKKSENERQRRRGPTIADIPYGRPRPSQALWMGLVVGLLLLNLGVLVFVLWPERGAEPDTPAAAPAPASTPAAASVPPAAPPSTVQASAEVRPLADEALNSAQPLDEAEPGANTDTEPKLVRSATAPGAPPRASQEEPGNLPTLATLGGAGALNLPELHLDIHVYSTTPAERFVFINMRKYTEGQTLQEGPIVQRVVNDGVVLDYGNRRFLLPRQ